MSIRDRDIRDALDTLETEVEHLEETIREKDNEVNELTARVSALENQIEEYQERITELENDLAESYLTSEIDDGIQREDADVSPGLGLDVSDSTND